MKILVTGCAGFIGSHLCEKLLEKNYDVVGIDNFDSFYSRTIKENNIKSFKEHERFEFHEFDLLDNNKLNELKTIDVVIHLAAKAGIRPSLDKPHEYIDYNIRTTQNILDFMVKQKITKYIFASSSSIYGNKSKIPFTEQDTCNFPISPYAYTKKAGEMMNYTYHYLYKIDTINLRFFTVYGPRQRPDLAIHKFVNKIKNNQPVEMFGDGQSARDYTFISDTIDGVCLSLNYVLNNNNIFEVFNIGNHYPVTLEKLIQSIYSELKSTPNIVKKEMSMAEVDITYADISKARRLLGYQPKVGFEEGIKMFINWYEQNF